MRVLSAAILLVAVAAATAQDEAEPVPSSVDAVGTEFVIFFEENAARTAKHTFDVQIFMTTFSEEEVSVRVSMPLDSDNNPTQNVKCKKGEVTEVNFPQTVMHIGSGVSNKGIYIISTGPIVVYGVNPQRFSSEGFISIPSNLLGTEYYSIGMPAEDQHSQLGVVAVLSGETEVTVTLPDNPELEVIIGDKTYSANDVITVTLSQYETFQVQHKNKVQYTPDGDMSGARIECSKRCAAFSGNSRTSVEGRSRDLLVEQLPPVTTWGKEFAIPPTPERTDRPDVLKLVCQQDGTNVLIDGDAHTCEAGGNIQVKISTDSAHYVVSTKPIMAASIVMSQTGPGAAIKADPAMTLVIPEEQYAQTYTIATATWSGAATDGNEYDNFLSVVIRRDSIDSMVIDGENVNTAFPDVVWEDVPGTATGGKSALVTAYFKVSSGTHTISTLSEEATFMCIVYGAGDRESYAYMGGMRLQVINPACTQILQVRHSDGKDNDCDALVDEEFCDATDNDGDGAVDEDCVIMNAVVPLQNETIMVGETTTLKWTVYATDFANFQGLAMYKQQAGAAEVLLAQGSAGLDMESMFSETGRYSLKVSEVERRGELDVVEVELTVSGATTQDPGEYRLAYTASDGEVDGTNKLSVKQNNQEYEIIARDLETDAIQTAKSSQAQPRNLYFQDGKDYSLTFHSIGGKHLDDLPYRLFLDDSEEVTADWEVTGLLDNYVTGQTVGLQDVKSVYQLTDLTWTADASFNQRVLASKNAASTSVVDAVLNVESLTRPSLSCRFSMEEGDETGQVICDITDVTVDLDTVFWEFDGNMMVTSGAGANGVYTATHTVDGSDATKYVAVLDGIKADQWPENDDTRVFKITFNQTNGYSLSAETPVSLSSLPAQPEESIPWEIKCESNMDGGKTYITCIDEGGNSEVTGVSWQCNTANDNTVVEGGSTVDSYTAREHRELGTSPYKYAGVMVVDRPIVSDEVYQVTFFRDGREETAEITVSGAGNNAPTLESDIERVNASYTLMTVTIKGAEPEPSRYTWTIPKADGTSYQLQAGDSDDMYSSSQAVTNDDGDLVLTLVTSDMAFDREIGFETEATSGDDSLWTGTASFTISGMQAFEPGTVDGESVVTGNGVSLTAFVRGGNPTADTFSWTLPDGSSLAPGESSGQYVASELDQGDGVMTFYLTIQDGLTTSAQEITFNASATAAAGSWSGSYTYNLPAISSVEKGVVDGEVEIKDDGATLTAYVRGGSPAAETFTWTLPDGSSLAPGGTSGQYVASEENEGDDDAKVFFLTLTEGLTPSTQQVTFNATATDSWWGSYEYNLPAKAVAATITPSAEFSGDSAVVTMDVTGGSPAMTEHEWSFTHDGEAVTMVAGDSQGPFTCGQPTDIDNGQRYQLTINDLSVLPKDFAFVARSNDDDGNTLWRSSATQSLTYQNSNPPRVDCGLRTNQLKVGDEAEIVCTVDPNGNTIDSNFYENIRDDGSSVNITDGTDNDIFTYSSKTNGDGTIEASLFFTLTDDLSDLTHFNFYSLYGDSYLQTNINLISLYPNILPSSSESQSVVGVETGSMTMTCRVQASGANSFDDITWTRTSYAPNGLVQTVVEDQGVQSPFAETYRFVESHRVTPDGFMESDLKINNLQRGDAAKYTCQYADSNVGAFDLDVIGTSFMVDNRPFNGILTDFKSGDTYNLKWEFESTGDLDYKVRYGGEEFDPDTHVIDSRDGTRYDSYAQGNIKVKVVTIENPSFSPEQTVIQTMYTDPTTGTDKQLGTYILKVTTVPGSRKPQSSFVSITTGSGDSFAKDQTVTVPTGDRTSVTVQVNAPTCNEDIKVLVGNSDKTASFTRTSQNSGDHCLITLIKPGYDINSDDGKTIQTVHVTTGGNVVLSDNPIEVSGAPAVVTTDKSAGAPEEPEVPQEPGTVSPPNPDILPNEQMDCDAGCDYGCSKSGEPSSCTCPEGMKLSANGKSCVDVDECATSPCGEKQKCINTYGSYECLSDCVCQCCEEEEDPGRKRRSVDDQVAAPAQAVDSSYAAALSLISASSLSSALAVLVWLSILTALTAITLFLTISNRRRSSAVKMNEAL